MSADLQELVRTPPVKNHSPAEVSSSSQFPRPLPTTPENHQSITPSTTPNTIQPSTEKTLTSIFHKPEDTSNSPVVNTSLVAEERTVPTPAIPQGKRSHFQKTCWSVFIVFTLPLLAFFVCYLFVLGTAWALLISIWLDTPVQQGPILRTPDMPIIVKGPDAPRKENKQG